MEVNVELWHIIVGILGILFLIGLFFILRIVSKVHKGASSVINKAGRELRLVNEDWEADLRKREGRRRR